MSMYDVCIEQAPTNLTGPVSGTVKAYHVATISN